MNNGVLKQIGTPEEIYKRPVDLFVARFVGSPRINSIEGMLKREKGKLYFERAEIKIELSDIDDDVISRLNKLSEGKIIATIRPEDIGVSKKVREGWLKVNVVSVLPAGSETIITVSAAGNVELSVKINGFTDIKRNDHIWINIDPTKTNYYDEKTGKLILSYFIS